MAVAEYVDSAWYSPLGAGETREIAVHGFDPAWVIAATASAFPPGPGGGGACLDVTLKSLVQPGGYRLVIATIRNGGPDVAPGFLLQFGWIRKGGTAVARPPEGKFATVLVEHDGDGRIQTVCVVTSVSGLRITPTPRAGNTVTPVEVPGLSGEPGSPGFDRKIRAIVKSSAVQAGTGKLVKRGAKG